MIGIDIGGTFTDFVYVDDDGHIKVNKISSTPDDPSIAFMAGLNDQLFTHSQQIVHGCTVATNAVLEGKGATTALITTHGFADVIEIGRQNRQELYSLKVSRPEPLVPHNLRFEVNERIDKEGNILEELTFDSLAYLIDQVKKLKVESIAISLLFSFIYPDHERQILLKIRETLPEIKSVFISSDVLPEFREYERTSTTVLNAYVSPPMSKYLSKLSNLLSNDMRIMSSSGGALDFDTTSALPVNTLLSGPAGGVVGAFSIAKEAGITDLITLDMGGTSTDVSLCPGGIQYTNDWSIGGYAVKVPSIDIETVGAGGGSIAAVDELGVLSVGPESAGADPGPSAYGKGYLPTVTDANLILGRLPTDVKLAGKLSLDVKAARESFAPIVENSNLSINEVALGVINIANSNMQRALRRVSLERGFDSRNFTLVAFGGAGPLHACELAESMGIKRVLIPQHPGALSALGMLLTDVENDYSKMLMQEVSRVPGKSISLYFTDLEEKAKLKLKNAGFPISRIKTRKFIDFRYQGQGYEVTVPYRGANLNAAVRRFHKLHHQRYGHSNDSAVVEIVAIRLKGIGITKKPKMKRYKFTGSRGEHAIKGHTLLVEKSKMNSECSIYSREKLLAGDKIYGPALVEQIDSTIFLPGGWFGKVDEYLNMILEQSR